MLERVAGHQRWVQGNRTPPRVAFDFAVLKAAAARDEAGAIALLSDAVHQGLTTADRLANTIAVLPRLRRRALLAEVLDASGVVWRDVRYPSERTLVELDGAFGHRDAIDRWADLQRDLAASASDHLTLRPGWAQVFEPCRLAAIVGRVLQLRGWRGAPRPCGPGCTVGLRG